MAEALESLGFSAVRPSLDPCARTVGRGTACLVVADVTSPRALRAIADAREIGVPSVHLMDGLVERRNTMLNPREGERYLRPSPADVVACAGAMDRKRLERLGNCAVATGLPRLDAILERGFGPAPGRGPVLVATANQAAFDDDERERLIGALGRLRDTLDSMGLDALWRITEGLDREIGVERDRSGLVDALASARAVVVTPSTLLVEAMASGRPTALLHPFEGECWQDAAWYLDSTGEGDIERMLRSMLAPSSAQMADQERVLAALHTPGVSALGAPERAAERLAALVAEMASGAAHESAKGPIGESHGVIGGPGRSPGQCVLWCVNAWCQPGIARRVAEAIGLARAARGSGGPGVLPLIVATQRWAAPMEAWRAAERGELVICLVDPTEGHLACIERVRACIAGIEPAGVIAAGSDIGAAATLGLLDRSVPLGIVADPWEALLPEYAEAYGAAEMWITPDGRVLPDGFEVGATETHSGEVDPGRWLGTLRALIEIPVAGRRASAGGVRLVDPRAWRGETDRDPEGVAARVVEHLRAEGVQRIGVDAPAGAGSSVVMRGALTPGRLADVRAWREAGHTVIPGSALIEPAWARLLAAGEALVQEHGCRRLAVYGAGAHTRRAAAALGAGPPFVAIADDAFGPGELFGLPVLTPREAVELHGVDGFVLSSDVWEREMLRSLAPLVARGVAVRSIYERAVPAASRVSVAA